MYVIDDAQDPERVIITPEDLARHVECAHRTRLALEVSRAPVAVRGQTNRRAVNRQDRHRTVHNRGDTARVLHRLFPDALELVPPRRTHAALQAADAATRNAIARADAPVILNAVLYDGRQLSRISALTRVEATAHRRAHYEVIGASPNGAVSDYVALITAVASKQLADAQGVWPEHAHVLTADERIVELSIDGMESVVTDLQTHFDRTLGSRDDNPQRVSACGACRFSSMCNARRRDVDVDVDVEVAPSSGEYRLRPPFRARAGLERLPAPDTHDIYFDIEMGRPNAQHFSRGGYPLLFGWVNREDADAMNRAVWAFDRSDALHMLDAWLTHVEGRVATHPGMHVYHFDSLELNCQRDIARLDQSLAMRVEELIDRGVFVDLYRATRETIVAERYGLQALEQISGYTRDARPKRGSKVASLMSSLLKNRDSDVMDWITRYNRDDNRSQIALHEFLHGLRPAMERAHSAGLAPVPARTSDATVDPPTHANPLAQRLSRRVRDLPPIASGTRAIALMR